MTQYLSKATKLILTGILFSFSLNIIGQNLEYENLSWEENIDSILNTITDEEMQQPEVNLKERRCIEYIYGEKETVFKYLILHMVVRVNNDEGIERNNKLYIPFSNTSEVLEHRARVINSNGDIREMDEKDIQEAVDEENNRMHKYFAVEGLDKGSVIEYIYKIKYLADYVGERIIFQSDIPKRNVSVEIISPDNLYFTSKSYNEFPDLEADTTESGKNVIRAKMDTIPMQKEETNAAYSPHLMQILFKLDRNSFTGKRDLVSYGSVSSSIYGVIFERISKNNIKTIKKLIKKIPSLKEAQNDEEKIRAVEDYAKTNFFVIDQSFEGAGDIDMIVSTGRCNEIGIVRLFANTFKEMGIKFEIVVGCSRYDYNFDKDFEVYNFLGKYLIYFPTIDKYLEPEGMFTRLGFIDPLLTGNNALFIKEVSLGDFKSGIGKVKFIEPLTDKSSQDNLDMDVTFNMDENNIDVKFSRILTGFYAQNYQPIYDFVKEDKVKELDESLVKYIDEDAEIKEQKVENKGSVNFGINPLVTNVDFTSEKFIEKAGNKYLFKLGLLIGPQMEMYQEKERTLPVTSPFNRIYNRKIKFTIPDGYILANLDAINISIKDKDTDTKAAFISSYTLKDNVLIVEAVEYYKQLFYPVEDFEAYSKVINAAADFNKIVIYLEKE